MKIQTIFLLLYSGVLSSLCSAQQNETCMPGGGLTQPGCINSSDPTVDFLTCVGVPEGPGAEQQHILNLKGLIEAMLDIYSFMRSSLTGVPALEFLQGFNMNLTGLQQNQDFVQFWLEVRLTSLLSSIDQQFLTCMSNSNFTCETYQMVVQKLSEHFFALDPVQQKWIYSFFIYPFLSKNSNPGCVDPNNTTENWLINNFGSFLVFAQIQDLTTLNIYFTALDVLPLLSPEQRADMLLNPELAGLDNSSMGVVLDSLLVNTTMFPLLNDSVLYPSTNVPISQDPVAQATNDIMKAFKPVHSFVQEFVFLANQPDLSSATFVQGLLNWTLAELAAPYKENNTAILPAQTSFNLTNVNDWFSYVVSPILRRFLPAEIPTELTEIFYSLFYINTGMNNNAAEPDICSVTLEEPSCAVNNLMEQVAKILNCAASANLSITPETLNSLTIHLTTSLNTLLNQLINTNFSSPDSPFIHILDRLHDLSPTNLQDPLFVSTWFQVKLKPSLSSLTSEYLDCLSAKPFSCQTYQILLEGMSNNTFLMMENGPDLVYSYFILPFLFQQNFTEACMTYNSSDWIRLNLAGFSYLATMQDIYLLNPDFNALETLDILTPKQLSELIVEQLPNLPEKTQVINTVFDFILESPEKRNLTALLTNVINFADQEGMPCSSYQEIVKRLYTAVVSMDLQQFIHETIDKFDLISPPDCLLSPPVTCLSIPVNETLLCAEFNSTGFFGPMLTNQMNVSCDLEQIACSPLTGFYAENLAKVLNCSLSSNITYSKEIWKLLFLKTSDLLNEAFRIFSSSPVLPGSGVVSMLDALVDVQLNKLTAEQWENQVLINNLFSQNLKPFLPSSSANLLSCLSSKNYSCLTYQHILMDYNDQFLLLDDAEKIRVLKNFILPYLLKNSSDPGCVFSSNDSVVWLQKNFGQFSELLLLRDLIAINPEFNPFLALSLLTPLQTVELMVDDFPELPDKNITINEVFNFLLKPESQSRLPAVLRGLITLSKQIPCSSYTVLSENLFWTLSFVSQNLEAEIYTLSAELEALASPFCVMTPLPTCGITSINESQICDAINIPSNEELIQDLYNNSCVNLDQFSCSTLDGFTPEDLAVLLNCSVSNNLIYPKSVWKLLFYRADQILDQTLIIYSEKISNQSVSVSGQSVSDVLDVLGEVRLDQFPVYQWSSEFITDYFRGHLRPFLSSVSYNFLQCLSTKNLVCQTFQDILQEFSGQFINMDTERQNVLYVFILPFLKNNTADPGCRSSFNDSVQWLMRNFGPFAELTTISRLISINPKFNPLPALLFLTPSQTAEVMLVNITDVPQTDAINSVFDFLLESPEDHKMAEVLYFLPLLVQKDLIPCDSYELIFTRMSDALQSLPSHIQSVIWTTINSLMVTSPAECLPPALRCPATMYNETQLCEGVDSSELQDLVTSGSIAQSLCTFNMYNYSCVNLDAFLAMNLPALLQCEFSSPQVYSKEIWKLFFSKISVHLEEALTTLSSTTDSVEGPNVPLVLEVLTEPGQLLGRFTPDQWATGTTVSDWLKSHLTPLLPSVSGVFLYCLSTKNLTCQSYQDILAVFSDEFTKMNEQRQQLVLKYFINPVINSNYSGGCVNNESVQWLLSNFGPFSKFVTLRQLITINPNFNPLSVLVYLTPAQTAELMIEDLPGLTDKNLTINTVFDFLLESPEERLPGVLQEVSSLSAEVPVSCETYQMIFSRLDQILTSSPGDLEPLIWSTVYDITLTAPTDCSLFPVNDQCPGTKFNVTKVCTGVQSITVLGGSSSSVPCDLTIPQYACTKILNLTSAQLVCVLENALMNGSEPATVETWKLFLTKVSNQLDSALDSLSNQVMEMDIVQASNLLDAVRELRLNRLISAEPIDQQLLKTRFNEVRSLLPFSSGSFLNCLGNSNFSCQTYQTIVQVFSNEFFTMTPNQQEAIANGFIERFLSSGPESVCASNESVTWLINNLGNFSTIFSLSTILYMNPEFDPLVALPYLTPVQIVVLLVFDFAGHPVTDVLINTVFDFLTESPREHGLIPVLTNFSFLVEFFKVNIPCSSYRVIFRRLDYLFPNVSMDLESVIVQTKSVLLNNIPPGCVIYSGECNVTQVNVTDVCNSVNTSALDEYLMSPHDGSLLCSFSITQYSCAQLLDLTPEDLVTVLSCKLSGNDTVTNDIWKLFVTNINPALGPTLDLFTNTTLSWSRPLGSFLNMIGEVTLSSFSSSNYRNSSFVQRWFEIRLLPFLPHLSPGFLSCLSTKDFSCETFQSVIQYLTEQRDLMSNNTAVAVYVDFIQIFLNRTAGCADGLQSSDWLSKNFGPFSDSASLADLQRLNPNFKPLDAVDRLTQGQLVQVISSPGLISTAEQVNLVMEKVPDSEFYTFFTVLSTALTAQVQVLDSVVLEALLQQVLDRANLSDPAVPDSQVQIWMSTSLTHLVPAITAEQVPLYFSTVVNRTCPLKEQAVVLLNSFSSNFSTDTQKNISSQIIASLKEPVPLSCYNNGSFFSFLKSSFLTFPLPTLSSFLSIIPDDRQSELLDSITTAELYSFLSLPDTVDDVTQLCQIFNNYQKTPAYLQNEPVISPELGKQTLGCVWSGVLSASSQDEVNQWFNVRLTQYLSFINSQLISPTQLSSASCLSFRKFVSVMNRYNFSSADFNEMYVYTSIQSYLNTDSAPKCYNISDPVLNSTSWFNDYIGNFIIYITLEDMKNFGDTELIYFTDNLFNLRLFMLYEVPLNVSQFYVELLYELNPEFSAGLLPLKFRCFAPAEAFTQLPSDIVTTISEFLQDNCTDIDPTVSAALAQSMTTVTASSLSALGNSSVGLSTGQISNTDPAVLLSSLDMLGTVVGWTDGQAMTIINSLLSSGKYKISSSDSLVKLGTLVTGVPSTIFNTITASELLKAFQSQNFLTSIVSASTIVQQTIVNQVILTNPSSDNVVMNIPDTLATQIPRNYLLNLTQSSAATLNQKQWKYEQSMLFFDTVANEIKDENSISLQVLQGFTCTRVQTFTQTKVHGLIKACKRRGNKKVVLQESQLTCMYNYVKTFSVTTFTDYPADLLLYYDYSKVDSSLCKAYFSALGSADFSVLSSTLSFKKQALFKSALQCLGISGFNISRSSLDILGNLTCQLNSSYIQNSGVDVLDYLKFCQGLTSDQVTAVENVLLTQNTTYWGNPSNWNVTTLNAMGLLPLYLTTKVWSQFKTKDQAQFLRTFIPGLLDRPGISKQDIYYMLVEAQKGFKAKARILLRSKRDTTCTATVITQVEANDGSFPFGYDVTQFNACLSVQVLKDNLASIAAKVVGSDYQQIVISKLNQAYPAGISDEVVQVLGPASRAATVTDITKWNITKIDSLSALMKTSDGAWSSDQVKAIVRKYLSVSGNSLGSLELNSLGGQNLCALDLSTISTISTSSLQGASALSVSNCSLEKQGALFNIAQTAFSDTNRASTTISKTQYQLISNYLGGATRQYIQSLATSGVNMDVPTLISLNPAVLNALTVADVKNLLGTNLPDLVTYQNNPVLRNWIVLQLQSDLETLGIGLTGGRASTDNTATTTTTTATVAVTKPSGAGSIVRAPTMLQQLLLLAVVIATVKMMHY